jgi:hypothetical protein
MKFWKARFLKEEYFFENYIPEMRFVCRNDMYDDCDCFSPF